jgi:hypothetical protein
MNGRDREGVCEQLESVAAYVVGALPPDEVSVLRSHIATCAVCAAEARELGRLVGSFVDWPTDVLRPATSLWERVAERVGANAASSARPDWVEPAWKDVAPGIACKLLAKDAARDTISMLVRLAPGAEYPPHKHAGVEELHLLDGELWINDRKLYPGDYNRATPGTSDVRVWSETGCTCVLVTSSRDELG